MYNYDLKYKTGKDNNYHLTAWGSDNLEEAIQTAEKVIQSNKKGIIEVIIVDKSDNIVFQKIAWKIA